MLEILNDIFNYYRKKLRPRHTTQIAVREAKRLFQNEVRKLRNKKIKEITPIKV